MEEGLKKQLIENIANKFAEVATVCTTACNGGGEDDLTTVSPHSDVPQTQGDKPGKEQNSNAIKPI